MGVHFKINDTGFAGKSVFLHHINGFKTKNCMFTLNGLCSGIVAGNNTNFAPNPYHNNIEITNCQIVASQGADGGTGIDLSHTNIIRITDNYIYGVGGDPIALYDCKNFAIKNNNCYSITGRITSLNSIY